MTSSLRHGRIVRSCPCEKKTYRVPNNNTFCQKRVRDLRNVVFANALPAVGYVFRLFAKRIPLRKVDADIFLFVDDEIVREKD